MTPLLFKDSFWGSDLTCTAGFDAVIQRLCDGRQTCKDVEELLKMRALAEEKYGKELLSIASKAGGHTEISTLRASIEQLKAQLENIGNFHIQLSDTLKEEVKKIEVFRERQKEQRKKFQSIMDKIQRKKVSLYKKTMESKKNYQLRCKEAGEVEKVAQKTTTKPSDKVQQVTGPSVAVDLLEMLHLKQPVLPQSSPEIVVQTVVLRIHQRARQFRQNVKEAEKLHSSTIADLESVQRDWEQTHKSTCEVFQQLEVDRIGMLRCALWNHCNLLSEQCVKDDESYEKVRTQLERCDIITDINCFIRMKSTGTNPPGPVVFERCSWPETPPADTPQTPADRRRLTRGSDPPTPGSGSADDSGGGTPLHLDRPQPSPTAGEDLFTVLFEYTAQEFDELSASRGETVHVLEQGEDGWWMVEKNGLTGLLPGNYLGKI